MNKVFDIFNRTLSIGTFYNIPFKVHWTIVPFFMSIPLLGYYNDMSIAQAFLLLLLVILILVSVLLHELGHATAAALEGIKTHDILISLIGGAARLEHMPEEPTKEIKIAFAGPLVNLILFILIAIPITMLVILGDFKLDLSYSDLTKPGVFFTLIAVSNLLLFLFNLIPAFPMDGGRILRAMLARKMSRERATKIAAIIGKILASVIIVLGIIFLKPIYSLIGIFVFLLAEIEHNQERNNIRLKKIVALDICNKDYHQTSLATPMTELIKSYFDDDTNLFIVMSNNRVKGIIDQHRLDDAMREKNADYTVSYYVNHRFAMVNVKSNLLEVYDELITKDMPVALVMDYGELIGIIDKKMLLDQMKL